MKIFTADDIQPFEGLIRYIYLRYIFSCELIHCKLHQSP